MQIHLHSVGIEPRRFAIAVDRAGDVLCLVLRHRAAYPYGSRQIAPDGEQLLIDRRRFLERFANREHIGEVGKRIGVLRLCSQHFPIARFCALRVAARFKREPKVV